MRWIAWDDYCTLLERVEQAAGGPAAFEALLARHYYLMLAEMAQVVGIFVSPEALYGAVFNLIMPPTYPNQEVSCEIVGPGRARVRARIISSARGCETFYRGSNAGVRGMSQLLGLPPAVSDAESFGDRFLDITVRLPESATAFSRVRRSSKNALHAVSEFIDEMGADLRQQMRTLSTTHRVLKQQTERVLLLNRIARELASHIDVDSLVQALVSVLHEHSTCDYVALWQSTESGRELVHQSGPAPARDALRTFALVVGGRAIGTLEVTAAAGMLDVSFISDLTPWLAIALDNAMTVGRVVRAGVEADGVNAKLQAATSRWAVTPRQLDVLKLVVRGLSNKEIAAALGCSENTVELHITQLLRKSASNSRAHLIAKFWTE